MPKRRPIYTPETIYHISARCINKEWFEIPMTAVWSIMSAYLFFIHHAFGCRIFAFVLMGNHFHLLISSPNAKLGPVMNYFMRETSRCIGFEAGRINQVYGAPYDATAITTDEHFADAYKYVYQNPLRAGIANDVLNYEWSTLPAVLGFTKSCIPLEADDRLVVDTAAALQWLNEVYKADDYQRVRKALKRPVFGYSKIKRKRGHAPL
ncbi:MAG: hypothetical protein EOO38_29320 [Cytophagaceae bacterium]|nr:MAG: hypothetical protein EOO38_29320 [Cytophagaceae bacterium]